MIREGFIRQCCPKCGGNVYLARDLDVGWCERCLQCSHTRYLETIVEVGEKVSKGGSGQAKVSKSIGRG